MKAKDYAIRYKMMPTEFTLTGIGLDFMKEMFDLAEARHISTDAGWVGVINEIDQKWQSFARQCDDLNPDGFRYILKEVGPKMYDGWMELRENNGRPAPKQVVYQPAWEDMSNREWLKFLFWDKE